MTTEFEEVILTADSRQLEQLGPKRCKLAFQALAWRAVVVIDVRHFGQGLAVDLAIDVQRQLSQRDDLRGHHVLGQLLAQRCFERVGRLQRRHVGHQPAPCHTVATDHGRFADPIEHAQACFDLAGLDTEAANLDLLIDAPEVIERAIFTPTHTVAGTVETPTRHAEGIGDEALGGHPRTLVITARQQLTADVQLADHTARQRLQVLVEYVQISSAHCLADGRISGTTTAGSIGLPQQGRDHRFGRPIAIDQVFRLETAPRQFECCLGHRVTTEAIDAHARRMAKACRLFGQLLQEGRREGRNRHLMQLEAFQGLLRRPQRSTANQQTGAVAQCS